MTTLLTQCVAQDHMCLNSKYSGQTVLIYGCEHTQSQGFYHLMA